jgi:signal peptidase I
MNTESQAVLESPETQSPVPATPAPPDAPGGEIHHRADDMEGVSPFDYLGSFLMTVLIALFGTTFVIQSFTIPSQSMEPTLQVGDYLFVNKFIFEGRGTWYDHLLPYRDIRRGDIVVFKFPYEDHPHFVKRAIGLPGDRIRIVNDNVYVNGQLLNEPYVRHDPAAADPFGDNFPPTQPYFLLHGARPEWASQIMKYVHNGELVVPPDHYFVMGDNRDHSWDSRYWGFVDRNAIMGRPVFIYWSVHATSEDYLNRSFSTRFISLIDDLRHLSTRTRWGRLMHEVH